jgi:hypothetical protein
MALHVLCGLNRYHFLVLPGLSRSMNGVAFQSAFLPWGDGTQFLPVSKKILKAMHAQPGDVIKVFLEERL